MAAIVYLDADDEITSAAARLRTLADDRIAMVLPLGSRLATSRINFRLLAREAAARKKILEIVTGDASTRALAASAGLATHTSVAAFEGRPEAGSIAGAATAFAGQAPAGAGPIVQGAGAGPQARQPGPGKPVDDAPTKVVYAPIGVPALSPPRAGQPVPQVGRRPQVRPQGRRVAIALGVIVIFIVVGVAGYQWLPNATVTLTPAVDQIGPIQLNVTAQAGITQPDPTRLLVPARTFSFDLDVSDTFPTTGIKVDEAAATGAVTFQNCDTSSAVTIPDGSTVATDSGIKFKTTVRISLKRAHLFPQDCPAGTVPIVANAPGLTGNVKAGAITKVPAGFDPLILLVRNLDPTTGGTHTETKQVAQADVDAAMAALRDKLAIAFDDAIAAAGGVPAGTKLFSETKALGTTTPSVDPKTLVDTVGGTFKLGLTAKGTVVGADPSPVSTLADARIRRSVKDGFNLVEDSIRIEVGTPLVTGSTITFPVIANAIATRELDVSVLRVKIHGLGLPQARTVLGEYGDVTITVWPDWVTTIPSSDDRLSFTITTPASPSASPRGSGSAPPSGSAP